MIQKIIDRVDKFAFDLLLDKSFPQPGLIAEILMFNATELCELSEKSLSMYIMVLGQYIVLLQYNENRKTIEHLLNNKTLEYKINLEKFNGSEIKGKTEKEKRAWIIYSNLEISDLEQEVLALEAEKTLLSGMVKAIENLLNALKKELSIRQENRG